MVRSMIAGLAVAAILTFGEAIADPAPSAEFSHYDLKATIEPAAGSLSVQGTIDTLPTGRQLSFALHRSFEITSLTVNGNKADFAYQNTGPTPVSRGVVVNLPDGSAGKPVRLGIAYRGTLEKVPEWGAEPGQKFGMDDQINGKLVYLAVYSFWYPFAGQYGQHFATDLTVSLPKGWAAVSGGAYRDLGTVKGRAITRWSVKDNLDIALTASPLYRRVAVKDVEVYHTQMPETLVTAEAENIAATMALFKNWLGDTEVPGDVVRHAYAPLEHGQGRAGIARPGLILTSEGRVREAMAADASYTLFQDVAHEIAHFWWNFGTGQGDWVNEAFAEYFSALAVRDRVSQAAFDAALERYRNGVAGLPGDAPSLATVPKQGGNSVWTIRYQKGSLMLDAVRRTMGDAAFFKASRDFFQTYRHQSAGTAEFRNFWGARLGGNKAMLDTWLDTGGGLVPAYQR